MSETIFTPGAAVITPHGRGTIVEVRAAVVFGVEDAEGEVRTFTAKALQLARD